MSIGIYKIENLINGHCYIGQSINIELRWKRHREAIKTSDYPLYLSIRKYGIENFSFEIIQECSIDELDELEVYWIQYYDSYYNGYNQTPGGSQKRCPIKISEEDLSEIVNLLKNSNMSQHEIAKKFNVGDDTISEINHGKTRIIDGISYPIRDNKKTNKKCSICGKAIWASSTLCTNCSNENRRIVIRPLRDELKQMIRLYAFTKIANKYGVADNTIKKWCINYNLPHKKKDILSYSDDEWNQI